MFVSRYTNSFFNTRIVRSVLFFVFLNTFIYNSLGQFYNARPSKGVVRSSINDQGIAEKIAIGDDETKYICSQLLTLFEVERFDPDMNEMQSYSFNKLPGTVLHINDAEFDNGKLYVVGSFDNTITVEKKSYTPFTNCVLSFLLVLKADLTIEFFGILGDKNGGTEYATTVINSVAIVDDVVSLGGYYGTKTNFALIEADDIPYETFTNGGFVVQYDKSDFHFKSKVFFENGDVQAIAKMSNGSIAVLAGFGVHDIKVIVDDKEATAVAYSKVANSRNFLVLELSPDLHFEKRYIFGSNDNPTYDLSDLICNADGCVLGGLAQGTGTLVTPNLTTVSNSFTTDPFLIYFNQGLEPKWATIIPHVIERLNVYGLGYDMHEKVFVITSGSGITNTNSKGRLDFVNINGEVTQTYENYTPIFYGVTNSATEFQIVGSSKSLSNLDMMGGSNLFPNLSPTNTYNPLVLTLENSCPANNRLYVHGTASGTGSGSTWTNAMTSLDDAIALANTCSSIQEIWVARGKYIPNSTQGFMLPPNVDLIGGFKGTETTKEERGDIFGNESVLTGNSGVANHVLNIQNAGNVTVDGFRIIEGGAAAAGVTNGRSGGGILIVNSNVALYNSYLSDNTANEYGGAIYATGTVGMNLKIENCVFYKNSGDKGGAILLLGNEINMIGGSIINCTFYQNVANQSVGADVFAENISTFSFANNLSFEPKNVGGGAIFSLSVGSGTFEVFNSGFTGEESTNMDGNNFINYTNIIDKQTFDFVTDFELDPSSPGVDFGKGTFTTLTTDIFGNQRIQGITVDIGATETVSSCAKPYLVTSTEDTYTIPICGELRYAVMAASNAGNKTVTFDPTVFKDSTTIKLTDKIVLDGEGVTIDGFVGGKQLIHITKSDPTLYGFDISGHANTIQGLTFGASTSEIPMIFIEGYKNRLLSNWFGVDPDGKEVTEASIMHVEISGNKNIIGKIDSGNVFVNSDIGVRIRNESIGGNASNNVILANTFGYIPGKDKSLFTKKTKGSIYLQNNATYTIIGDNDPAKMNSFWTNNDGPSISFENASTISNRVFGNVFYGEAPITRATNAQESIDTAYALSFNILDSTLYGISQNATKVSIYISKSTEGDIGELFIKDVDVISEEFTTVLNLDTIPVDYDMITVISHTASNSSSIFSTPLAICRNPFFVDKTVDDPNVCGSIRLANNLANINGKADEITFADNLTITLDATLELSEGKTYFKGLFDNTDKVPDVVLKASANTFEAIKIKSDSNIIEGINFGTFQSSGASTILVEDASYNKIRANYIGVLEGGAGHGIIFKSTVANSNKGNTVGELGKGNVISGNSGSGISISGINQDFDSLIIHYNKIGLAPDGLIALPNERQGITMSLASASSTIYIDSNYISGNKAHGMRLTGVNSTFNVTNNYIGLSANGESIRGNENYGIDGSSSVFIIQGNAIAGNANGGVNISSSSFDIRSNKIGLTVNDDNDPSVGGNGITITSPFGQPRVISDNVISANMSSGIYIDSDDNTATTLIEKNFIGTNRAGSKDLGNTQNGIHIVKSESVIVRQNLISGNETSGIYVEGASTDINIYTNTIGLHLKKDAPLGNLNGITIASDQAQVVIDSANVIAGNGSSGIILAGAKNIQITRNYIGTNQSLDPNLGNQKYGIVMGLNGTILPTGNVIGGYGFENHIYDNGDHAIFVESGSGNTFFKNYLTT